VKTIFTVVFKAAEGGGNPDPVTLDADELTTEEMLAMAKKFGYESSFVLKPTRPDCDVRYRYFMPLQETEMCLHDTIGTSTVLIREGRVTRSPFFAETMLGPIRIDWTKKGDDIAVAVKQFLPEVKKLAPTKKELCRALGIRESDLGEGPVESVSTSRFKLIVPLRNKEILNALQPDFPYLQALCGKYETTGFCPFAPAPEEGKNVYYDRQFPQHAGYNEDPATGVAASALGAYLVLIQKNPQNGWHTFEIYQGFAMGRPSHIGSDVLVENGKITETRVRGSAEVVTK
jgi:PhzF family phenazine biosynthesis protein